MYCKRFFQISKSLKFEIIAFNIIIIVCTLLITTLISYINYKNTMLDEASDYGFKILSQLNSNIDMYLEDMVNLSILTNYDKDLQSVLKADESYFLKKDILELYKQDKLRNFLFTLNNLRTEIDGIFMYNRDRIIYYNSGGNVIVGPVYYGEQYNFKDSIWYKKAKQADGESVIVGPHYQEQIKDKNNLVLSVAKIIKDSDTSEEIGCILIDINLSKIERICQNVIYNNSENIAIFDQEGKLIYCTYTQGDSDIDSQLERIRQDNYGSYISTVDGKQQLINFITSDYSSWKVVKYVPLQYLLKNVEIVRKLTLITLFISVCCAVVLLYFILNKMISPIYNLREKMKLVENGDLNVSVEIQSENEIGKLSENFNNMVKKLRDLVHRVYEVQLQKKEAQLTALQSQINPHFLYNTLESIHMMAEINQDYQVSEMATSLGNLFRYSIKKTGDFVTIGDELEHVNNYITIQKIRYEDKFDVFINVKRELKEYKIIKLTLQPLVENAIYHGLENKKGKGYIIITAQKINDVIKMSIIDNGVGMSKYKLQQLINSFKDFDKNFDRKNIGLNNVNNRIKSYFGTKYGIEIESAPNKGTEIKIIIPAIK